MKGFIFDLDGVIVDTAKYHFSAWRRIAKELGSDFTEIQNEQLKGLSRSNSLRRILSWANKELSTKDFETVMDRKNGYYLEYVNQMTKSEILDGVVGILDYLIQKKQKIALGSASKNAIFILEKIGLIETFDVVVDGNKVSNSKPDPEVFLTASKQLNIPAEHCVVFEDALSGVEAANSANMLSIGIGSVSVLSRASYVFASMSQIPIKFMDKLFNQQCTKYK